MTTILPEERAQIQSLIDQGWMTNQHQEALAWLQRLVERVDAAEADAVPPRQALTYAILEPKDDIGTGGGCG